MASITAPTAHSAIVRLEWESNHFGVSAATLNAAQLSDDALVATLQHARATGVQLLVWPAESGRVVPQDVLHDFGGMLVDQKATFSRPLDGADAGADSLRATDVPVVAYDSPTVSTELVQLALAAGAHSRFRVDPRIPRERFEAMYHMWIARSVARELADTVLVAPRAQGVDHSHGQLGGMITLSRSGSVASIGLVAVAAAMRKQGIGSALIRAAHGWMRNAGAHEARVVTQLANQPACQLYERSGYRLLRVQPYHHFWL